MKRPRIKPVEQRLMERYRELGYSAKEAFKRIEFINFKSEMQWTSKQLQSSL